MLEETKKKEHRLLNNAILFFIILTCAVILISTLGSIFGFQATYTRMDPVTNDTVPITVAFENMFSAANVQTMISSVVTNFVTFIPLGLLLVSSIGIGVAYKSGLLTVVFGTIGKFFNKFWLTFFIVIIGILSNFAGEMSYIFLIPLTAIFFLVNNRNPIVGMLVSFVSIAAGSGVNFLATSLDYSLVPYTNMAGRVIDKNFSMNIYGNIFFTIVCSIALAFLITYITEKIVLPKVPKYKRDELMIDEISIGRKEKRGLILALVGSAAVTLIFIYMIIPGLPSSGLLLDKMEATYLGKLFGANSYFTSSLIYFVTLILTIGGLLYGFGARTIKTIDNFTEAFYQSLNNIGSILVLIFFASQFIAIFKMTQIGTVMTVWFMNIVQLFNFSSIPLILLLFIAVGISNIFLTSTITKWAIFSPIIIPLFMKSNITPEFTQAIYRVSESATSVLTPLLAYFVIFIGYVELYNKEDKSVSMKDCYKMLWPYTIGLAVLWLFIIAAWYIIGLPIGMNAYPTV